MAWKPRGGEGGFERRGLPRGEDMWGRGVVGVGARVGLLFPDLLQIQDKIKLSSVGAATSQRDVASNQVSDVATRRRVPC